MLKMIKGEKNRKYFGLSKDEHCLQGTYIIFTLNGFI